MTEGCDDQARETLGSPLRHRFLTRPLWTCPCSEAEGAGPSCHLLGLQQLGVGHALEPVGEQLEGAALGQQHEQAVEGLDQVRVVLHVQQLQAQICGRQRAGSGVSHCCTLHLGMARRGPASWPWHRTKQGLLNSHSYLRPVALSCPHDLTVLSSHLPTCLCDLPSSHLSLVTSNLLPGLAPAPMITASLASPLATPRVSAPEGSEQGAGKRWH